MITLLLTVGFMTWPLWGTPPAWASTPAMMLGFGVVGFFTGRAAEEVFSGRPCEQTQTSLQQAA